MSTRLDVGTVVPSGVSNGEIVPLLEASSDACAMVGEFVLRKGVCSACNNKPKETAGRIIANKNVLRIFYTEYTLRSDKCQLTL